MVAGNNPPNESNDKISNEKGTQVLISNFLYSFPSWDMSPAYATRESLQLISNEM